MAAYLPAVAAISIYTTMPPHLRTTQRAIPQLLPAQEDADIARHAARIVDDLVADVIATRPELALPEVIDLLGNAGQGLLPSLLGLVDGAAVVAAKRMGKAIDLDRGETVLDGAVHDDRCAFEDLVVGQTRWLAHLLQQGLLLRLGHRMRLRRGRGLLALGDGDLLAQFLGAQNVGHNPLSRSKTQRLAGIAGDHPFLVGRHDHDGDG